MARDWRTIIGIAADVRGFDLTSSAPSFIAGIVNVPFGADATMEDARIPTEMTVAVRTGLPAAAVAAAARAGATEASGEIALSDVTRMNDVLAATVTAPSAITLRCRRWRLWQ